MDKSGMTVLAQFVDLDRNARPNDYGLAAPDMAAATSAVTLLVWGVFVRP